MHLQMGQTALVGRVRKSFKTEDRALDAEEKNVLLIVTVIVSLRYGTLFLRNLTEEMEESLSHSQTKM